MSKALQEEFEATYRACFPIAAELQPNLFSFELDDGEYVEAKVHVAFTLWLAARATADHRDSVPEGWKLVTKRTHFELIHEGCVIASLAGPHSEENAAIIARAIAGSAPKEAA